MATTDFDHKATTDRFSDDNIGPAGLAPDHSSSRKLVPPPLVAAMTAERRLEAEAKMRRKIDTRLLPMIILMYIMNYLGKPFIVRIACGTATHVALLVRQEQHRGGSTGGFTR